jgi:general stress protein 26
VAELTVDDLENLALVTLTPRERLALLDRQTECTVVFTLDGGWPVGVVMSFMHVDGRFWLTATDDRRQVTALSRDPRMCLVVSNAGTGTTGRQMVSYRGFGVVHRDRATLEWFLPRWAARLAPASADAFVQLLDSPRRVTIEFIPIAVQASHDSRRMLGDGRGGAGGPRGTGT